MKQNAKVILVIYYIVATVVFADMIDRWASNGGIYNLLAGLILAFVLHSLWKMVYKEKLKK